MSNTAGPGSTVTTTNADFPPAVAEIVVEPGATVVTTPDALTVTTEGAPVSQVTAHPPAGVGPTVASVAVSVIWSPATMVTGPGEMLMLATEGTGAIVTVAVADLPPEDAVTTAMPAAIARTFPPGDTVATAALLVAHVTGHPPAGGVPVAVSVAVITPESPTTSESACGATVTPVTAEGVVPVPGTPVVSVAGGVVPPVVGGLVVSVGVVPPVAGGVVVSVGGVLPVVGGVVVPVPGGGVVPELGGPVMLPEPSLPPHDAKSATTEVTTTTVSNRPRQRWRGTRRSVLGPRRRMTTVPRKGRGAPCGGPVRQSYRRDDSPQAERAEPRGTRVRM
jgi:hypothetical protein